MNRQPMKLRPYQVEAIRYLRSHDRAGLFIDMGLGKTAIILHALLDLPKPAVVVGPIRVVETVWAQEAKLWDKTKGLTFTLVRGTPQERSQKVFQKTDILLVNPELLPEVLALRPDLKTLVLDESSMYKNPSTQRFKVLKKHLNKFKNRIISTGTPAPNSLMDLWSQTYILDDGDRLDRAFYRFQNRYFYTIDYRGFQFAAHDWAEEEILKKLSDIIFRVEASVALEPRQRIDNTILCPMPVEAMVHYRAMERRAFAELEDSTLSAATAATKLMKLRQMASGFAYTEGGGVAALHTAKIDAVKSILQETGSPVVLLYQFRHELAALKKAFPDGVEFESNRIDDWNKGKIPLLFLHPQSGGHGINLQYGGHTMIVYSASFSYEQMTQAVARIDRQGQVNPVIVHHLISPGTVDELLMDVLETKEKGQSQILEKIKEYASAKVNSARRA